MTWLNRFRLKADQSVIHEFTCTCPPMSHAHERMLVSGALINMRDDCYLEDGVPEDRETAQIRADEQASVAAGHWDTAARDG